MPQQTINIGAAPDDGTGDTLRVGGDKINDNFTELYAADAALGTAAPLDVDPDDTLAADSDSLIPTQQAVKAYVDANVGGSVAELDDVGDVNAPTPANGDVLTWDSTPGEWVSAAPTGGSNALDDLTDVDAPTPADGDVLTYDSGSGDWVPAPSAGGGGLVKISTQVLGSAAATIDFSSISAAYEDLEIVIQGRGSAAATSVTLAIRANGDTGNNYDYSKTNRFGNVSNVAQSSAIIGSIVAASGPSDNPSQVSIRFVNYKRTTFRKTFLAAGSVDESTVAGGQYPEQGAGLWRNTAAITQLTLLLSSGNFVAGTVATLYGRG